ncbi:MAG: hypothetical protein BGO26_16220 [Actinobacteria bacterium 69-20]|nr:hypothetical protein [Actinomycetota bacterium]OJV27837.1 MAG: hypothetical protein BGO26_16220 [Actinobacteria bacterium 69-20]
MTARWISGLVRARQFAEDNAKNELRTAEKLASRAHARVRYNAERLESLHYAQAEENAATFVAAAVALQAAAATHAAAAQAAEQAERAAAARRSDLTDAAISRRSAEELAERARAAEKARQAALAQRAQDEIAASVFRRHNPSGNAIPDGTISGDIEAAKATPADAASVAPIPAPRPSVGDGDDEVSR